MVIVRVFVCCLVLIFVDEFMGVFDIDIGVLVMLFFDEVVIEIDVVLVMIMYDFYVVVCVCCYYCFDVGCLEMVDLS